MARCYASGLGDCEGPIEDEHFIPKSLQDMLGPVTVEGLRWQQGSRVLMQAGSYAHSRVLCRRHHDELDGIDGVAFAYFKNLMLIASPKHVRTGALMTSTDIAAVIHGRALERWFLKTICGGVSSRNIDGMEEVPRRWIEGLFARIAWPEEWALHVALGKRVVTPSDASFHMDFHWTPERQLNGLVIRAFAFETLFSIEPLDLVANPDLVRRPANLSATVTRPGGGEAVSGVPTGHPIQFQMTWV